MVFHFSSDVSLSGLSRIVIVSGMSGDCKWNSLAFPFPFRELEDDRGCERSERSESAKNWIYHVKKIGNI